MNEVKNKILKTELVKWKDLQPFQNTNLKEMSVTDYNRLKESIIKNNFIQTFMVWENKKTIYCIDGHHRLKILAKLEEEGFQIPEKLPCNFVDFKSKKEAAAAVLIYSSQYAKITSDGLYEFLTNEQLEFKEIVDQIDIPQINFDAFEEEFFESEKKDLDSPDGFKKYDENISVSNKCPKCGYEWS